MTNIRFSSLFKIQSLQLDKNGDLLLDVSSDIQ